MPFQLTCAEISGGWHRWVIWLMGCLADGGSASDRFRPTYRPFLSFIPNVACTSKIIRSTGCSGNYFDESAGFIFFFTFSTCYALLTPALVFFIVLIDYIPAGNYKRSNLRWYEFTKFLTLADNLITEGASCTRNQSSMELWKFNWNPSLNCSTASLIPIRH